MAAQRVKGVAHHQQLAGGVDVGPLNAARVPRVANLHPLHGGQDVMEARAAQHLATGLIGHGKGEAVAFFAHLQRGLDVATRLVWLGHRGDAQLPQFAVGGGGAQAVFVRQFQRHQVQASVGHIRDLVEPKNLPPELKKGPLGKFSIDVDNGFEPYYVVSDTKKKTVLVPKEQVAAKKAAPVSEEAPAADEAPAAEAEANTPAEDVVAEAADAAEEAVAVIEDAVADAAEETVEAPAAEEAAVVEEAAEEAAAPAEEA